MSWTCGAGVVEVHPGDGALGLFLQSPGKPDRRGAGLAQS